jgi:hypothetical protein
LCKGYEGEGFYRGDYLGGCTCFRLYEEKVERPEDINQKAGKKLVGYRKRLEINPEEFGERPLTRPTSAEKPGRRTYVTSGCQVGSGRFTSIAALSLNLEEIFHHG